MAKIRTQAETIESLIDRLTPLVFHLKTTDKEVLKFSEKDTNEVLRTKFEKFQKRLSHACIQAINIQASKHCLDYTDYDRWYDPNYTVNGRPTGFLSADHKTAMTQRKTQWNGKWVYGIYLVYFREMACPAFKTTLDRLLIEEWRRGFLGEDHGWDGARQIYQSLRSEVLSLTEHYRDLNPMTALLNWLMFTVLRTVWQATNVGGTTVQYLAEVENGYQWIRTQYGIHVPDARLADLVWGWLSRKERQLLEGNGSSANDGTRTGATCSSFCDTFDF